MAIGRTFPNEIDRILNAPGGPIGRESRQLALQIARNAEAMATMKLGKHPGDRPRTGEFARGFQVRVAGRSTEFYVVNTKPYAAALEAGARPHIIRARKTTLRFRGRDGRWRNVKLVRHPGNAAYRILENAALAAMRQRYGRATAIS